MLITNYVAFVVDVHRQKLGKLHLVIIDTSRSETPDWCDMMQGIARSWLRKWATSIKNGLLGQFTCWFWCPFELSIYSFPKRSRMFTWSELSLSRSLSWPTPLSFPSFSFWEGSVAVSVNNEPSSTYLFCKNKEESTF